MERVIFHSDMNSFYASVECLHNPDIRDKAVVVGGSEEARHGIVLAANQNAKKFYIKTGDALWQTRQKCRDLVVVPPHYDEYIRFSKAAQELYAEYSPLCESFGLDEAWLDLSGSTTLADGAKVADEIRSRIQSELGITASVGVSYNKIFAKLGSDMKKPDATTVITPEDYQDKAWSLPVSDLLYVGKATAAKLRSRGIETIGRLARTSPDALQRMLGKWGITLWQFANGLDNSPVAKAGSLPFIKSIGNSTTAPRDLLTVEDIRITVFLLAESVAERLREQHFKCQGIQVWIRYSDLSGCERQIRLPFPCCTAQRIANTAMELILKHETGQPIRSLGVRAINLLHDEYPQLSLLPEIQREQRQENLEYALDHIRSRYGNFAVRRGIMHTDPHLADLSPKDDHIIFPVSYFK